MEALLDGPEVDEQDGIDFKPASKGASDGIDFKPAKAAPALAAGPPPAPGSVAGAGELGLPQPAAHPAVDMQPSLLSDPNPEPATIGQRVKDAVLAQPAITAAKDIYGAGKNLYQGAVNTVGQTGEDFDRPKFLKGLTQLITGGGEVAFAIGAPEITEIGQAALAGDSAAKLALTKLAAGIGVGTGASYGAGKVADKYNLTPEAKELLQTAAFFGPALVGNVEATKGEFGAKGVKASAGPVSADVGFRPAYRQPSPEGGYGEGSTVVPGKVQAGVSVGGKRFGTSAEAPIDFTPTPPKELPGLTPQGQQAGKATSQHPDMAPAMEQATPVHQPVGQEVDGRTVVQPTDNPAINQALATSAMPEFKAGLEKSLKSVPGATLAAAREEKNPERLAEKINGEAKPAETIGDYGAVQIKVDSPEARDAAVAAIKAKYPVVSEDDKFDDGDEDYGYRNHSLQVQTPNGSSMEVQIVPKEVLEANPDQHHDYKAAREAEISGNETEFARKAGEAKAKNDAAMAAFNARNGVEESKNGKEGGRGESPEQPGAEGASPSAAPAEPATIAKGSKVKLKDGTIGTVNYYPWDPKGKARVTTTDGRRLASVPLSEMTAIPPEEPHVDLAPIGKPLTTRTDQIKAEIAKGTDVRIFSARVADDPQGKAKAEIEQWSEKNLGKKLPVTNQKDDGLAHILDDKANVEPNANTPFDIPEIPKGKWLGVDLDKTMAVEQPQSGEVVKPALEPSSKRAATGGLQPGEVGRLPLSNLHVDPKRFQYKLNTDSSGSTSKLKDVKWNDALSGIVTAWHDPEDGKDYVVNGHHRYDLANRHGVADMAVRMLPEDVRTAAEARIIGAVQNIAEGNGTAIDAAKFLRDTGRTPDDLSRYGVSMSGPIAEGGAALAKLDQKFFDDVVAGRIPERRGIAIAKAAPTAADQEALVKLIGKAEARGKTVTNATIEELGRMVKGSGEHTATTESLFGTQTRTQNLALEKADVSAFLRNQIAQEKKLFAGLTSSSKAEKLGTEGNKIDTKQNAKVASSAEQAQEIYDRLSTRTGPVDDILNHAAKRIAGGDNANTVKSEAYRSVRTALSEAIRGGLEEARQGRAVNTARPETPESPPEVTESKKPTAAELAADLRARGKDVKTGAELEEETKPSKQDLEDAGQKPMFARSLKPRSREDIENSPQFKEWFGRSKVVGEDGKPQVVFRGDYRGDKLGNSFKINRSTSGRFYFTDDPEIASNYATGKLDQRHYEDNADYENHYTFPGLKHPGERTAPDLGNAWWRLSEEQKARVKKVVETTAMSDQGDFEFDSPHSFYPNDDLPRVAREQRGNWLKVAQEIWLNSAGLYGEEGRFVDILDHAGLDARYDNPRDPRSVVTPVYLSIQNPLPVHALPEAVIDRLRQVGKLDRSRAKEYGVDMWDKTTITAKEWVQTMEEELANNPNRDLSDGHLFTRVPEKITEALQSMGYDGINDTGGKNGGPSHHVWVAFDPGQIKSAIANRGTFDRDSPNILFNRAAPAPTWYLKSEKLIDQKMKGPMTGEQLMRMLENGGVKADELKWTGIGDFLKGKFRVTPEQVKQHLAEGGIQIKEVTKGGAEPPADREDWKPKERDALREKFERNEISYEEGNKEIDRLYDEWKAARDEWENPKYSGYQLPGGENYREMLLTTNLTGVTPTKPPVPVAELPPGYEIGHDSSQPVESKYHVIPPGQVHARPFAGRHRTIEIATHAALHRINEDQHEAWKASKTKEAFMSGHWDEPNILAHVRMNDRTTPDGKKLLHIEEIQSDWHQKGRDKGYRTDVGKATYTVSDDGKGNFSVVNQAGESVITAGTREYAQARADEYNRDGLPGHIRERDGFGEVPDAPFKKDWHEMSFRRMVRMAAEQGYDGVSWTPGEKQAERYDLSKKVDTITYSDDHVLHVIGKDNRDVMRQQVPPEKLPDYIGKETAHKLMDHPADKFGSRILMGLDLKVGGEGMKGFYDKIIPDYARKFGKQWGATVGETEIPGDTSKLTREDFINWSTKNHTAQTWGELGERWARGREDSEVNKFYRDAKIDSLSVPYLPITPEMRKAVTTEGVSMFQRRRDMVRDNRTPYDPRGKFFTVPGEGEDAPMVHLHPEIRDQLNNIEPELAEGGKWAAVSLPKAFTDKLTERLRLSEWYYADDLADTIDQSRDAGGNAILLTPAGSGAVSEEQFHSFQHRQSTEMGDVMLQIGQSPEVLKAQKYLKSKGYSGELTEAAQEATAKTFNGDWAGAGLTRDEGAALLNEFLDAVVKVRGNMALMDLPKITEEIADIIEGTYERHQIPKRERSSAIAEAGEELSARPDQSGGEGLPGEPRGAPPGGYQQGTQASLFKRKPPVESFALPGMEGDVERQAESAAEVKADDTRETVEASLTSAKGDISKAAGKMERESPLFRETEASGQRNLFQRSKDATGDREESEPLSDLIDKMKDQKAPERDLIDRFKKESQRSVDSLKAGVSGAENALAGIKGIAAAAWDSYRRPPEWTDFKDATGKFQAAEQFADHAMNEFADEIKRVVPAKARREAMTNFVEAGGSARLLKERAAQTADQKLKKGYELAQDLTPEEKKLAGHIREYLNAQLDQAMKLGMLEQGARNYITHIHEKDAKGLQSLINFGELAPDPAFLKKRVFSSYFEGEQLGFMPRDKDIGYLTTAYHDAFTKALASRAYIASMLEGKAEDGRPLAILGSRGKWVQLGPDEAVSIMEQRKRPDSVVDYQVVDHPALRNWNWDLTDEDAAQVSPKLFEDPEKALAIQGDLLLHPEIAGKVRNILGRSAIAANPLGKAALKVSSTLKQALLSFSGFHQTQEGVHALEHRVLPAKMPELDFKDPTQRALVEHGLVVADFDGQSSFSEGISGTELTRHIPIVGEKLHAYQDYLFRSYIPRLKMQMAKHALSRNQMRYKGKLDPDQILELTANQANAAFGGLNYKMMGRNKTFQDLLRLSLLAPDFLEARARFAAQATKPYGQEQRTALILGALVLYATARILNAVLNDGDMKLEPSMAFSVAHGGHKIGLRTVQGDILRLVTDPRSFAFNRLNPMTARPTVEFLTGRDQFGRQKRLSSQARDYLKSAVPIPVQGYMNNLDQNWAESIANALGLETGTYRSPAEQEAFKQHLSNIPDKPDDEDKQSEGRLHKRLENELRDGKMTSAQLWEMVPKKLTPAEAGRIMKQSQKTPLENYVSNLDIEQMIPVYEKANAAERELIRPVLMRKRPELAKRTPKEREKVESRLEKLMEEDTKLRASR